MPELCRFFGIVVTMYYNDHPPAHIHLRYGANRARMSLADGTLLDGDLPRQALNRVRLWRDRHEQALLENWQRAANREPLLPIEPLE
ncbi:MAG: DUF4160 domain-containing protein [Hyphomicrobiaceae bacterium]